MSAELTPEQVAEAEQLIGRPMPLWSERDYLRLVEHYTDQARRHQEQADAAEFVARRAEQCGCPVAVPDGDLSRAYIAHVCGAPEPRRTT